MAVKNLLVHVGEDDRNESRIQAACTLARRDGAVVTGIYVRPYPVIVPAAPIGGAMPIIEGLTEAYRKACEAARARFETTTQREGVPSAWHDDDGDVAERLALHGRYADLVVVGQWSPDEAGDRLPRDLAGLVALLAGRPVLALPYAGKPSLAFSRVLLCWNGSREAARAAHDMLALLPAGAHVDVACVDPEDAAGRDPGADIARHLAAHGLDVQAHPMASGDIDVADALLSVSADLGSELIVMGAYGHARVREMTFGGVTRRLLAHMPVPLLLSH